MASRPTLAGVVAGIFVVIIAAICIRLGLWQLDRLEQRQVRNAMYSAALEQPVLELVGDTLHAVRSRPEEFLYRRARVRGEPDTEREVVWRGRSLNGRPGVNVLTPYRVETGTVLVNRGWAPSPDAAHVQLGSLRETVSDDPVGVLVALSAAPREARPIRLEMDGACALSVQIPDYGTLAGRIPGLLPLSLQMLPDGESAGLTRLPLPDLDDEGPHLGYAIQWFAFAAIASLGFLTVVFLRLRSPRA